MSTTTKTNSSLHVMTKSPGKKGTSVNLSKRVSRTISLVSKLNLTKRTRKTRKPLMKSIKKMLTWLVNTKSSKRKLKKRASK